MELLNDTAEVSADAAAAQQLARSDLNFLGALANPDEFVYNFPPFYLTLFSLLIAFKQRVERYAIGIPRGFAKTTFIKILCLHYILFSKKQFILIVGASEDLAVNTLADICDLLSTPNIRKLFGNWQLAVEVNTQALKVFHFRGRDIVLRAIGAGTAVRGINRKNKRPDVIIMDDIQKREIADSVELSDQLLRWMLGTLGKARSNDGCTYIFIGNMYPQNSILQKLKENPQWTSFIVGGILADGTSLWEELRPVDELLDDYESDLSMGHPEIFASEILNSTEFTGNSGLDFTKIPQTPDYYLSTEADGSFIIIDPSSGKKLGDDCTIEHYDVIDGVPILNKLIAGTFSPLETIKQAIDLGLEKNTRCIAVEGVAYQSTLLFWFDHYCETEGITGFDFVELSPKGQAKNNRIKRGALQLIAGEIYLHPTVKSLVINQYMDWNPMKVDNKDDIIDPIGYVSEVMKLYSHLVVKNVFDVDYVDVKASHSTDIAMAF